MRNASSLDPVSGERVVPSAYDVQLSTLNQLIMLISSPRKDHEDEAFQKFTQVFFTTHLAFTSSTMVFDKLVERANGPIGKEMPAGTLDHVKKAVCGAFRFWLLNHVTDFTS